jgi:hypothetical protein
MRKALLLLAIIGIGGYCLAQTVETKRSNLTWYARDNTRLFVEDVLDGSDAEINALYDRALASYTNEQARQEAEFIRGVMSKPISPLRKLLLTNWTAEQINAWVESYAPAAGQVEDAT